MARPTICTSGITEQIAKYLAEGQYMECACGMCEPVIPSQDAYNWLKWGAEGKDATGPDPDAYRTFFETVTRAEAQAERTVVMEMRRAAIPHSEVKAADGIPLIPGDVRAQEIFLKRRFPRRWGDMQRTELTGPGGGPVQVEQSGRLELTGASALAVLEYHDSKPEPDPEPEVDEVHSAPADA